MNALILLPFLICAGIEQRIESDVLWQAICMQESGGDVTAYNAEEDAAGIAQIRPTCLRDCNRIIGYQRWTLSDRYNPVEARAMFLLYTGHYMRHYDLHGPEAAARIWCGGPNGWRKDSTLSYWAEVKGKMR